MAGCRPTRRYPTARQALVRPLTVACCDLDVGVAQGALPMPPGHAVGHEGLAEVVAVGDDVTTVRVGDRVVVPFQINCGQCSACRRGVTGSCASLPLMAMYGMAPLAGLDGGGFMSDLVLVPFADAMLLPVPAGVDPVAIASLSDNIPDGWRGGRPVPSRTGRPRRRRPSRPRGRPAVDRPVRGGVRSGLRRAGRLRRHRRAAARRWRRSSAPVVHDRPKPDKSWDPYPVTVHTSADPSVLASTLRATWPDGVCTDTGIYYQGGVEMPLLPMYTRGVRFVTGRVNARAVIPEILELLTAACDLSPAVDRVVPWDDAPSAWPTMTGKTVFTRQPDRGEPATAPQRLWRTAQRKRG